MKKYIICFFLLIFSQSMYAEEIMVDGIPRTYQITNANSSANGIVFVLHHLGGNAQQMKMLGFDQLARQDNYIVIYPEAIQGQWNASDMNFIKQLMDKMILNYSIPNRHVYIAGASSGGVLAHGLATRYSQTISAIATVGSALPQGVSLPARSVSALIINGTHDPIIPYNGGANGLYAAADTVNFWVQADRCNSSISSQEAEASPIDGTRIFTNVYSGGKEGTEIAFYTIEGGGHTWPGGPILPESFFGRTCQHINATEIIWQFFRTH